MTEINLDWPQSNLLNKLTVAWVNGLQVEALHNDPSTRLDCKPPSFLTIVLLFALQTPPVVLHAQLAIGASWCEACLLSRFAEGIGRTTLCGRLTQHCMKLSWLYKSKGRILHQVPNQDAFYKSNRKVALLLFKMNCSNRAMQALANGKCMEHLWC